MLVTQPNALYSTVKLAECNFHSYCVWFMTWVHNWNSCILLIQWLSIHYILQLFYFVRRALGILLVWKLPFSPHTTLSVTCLVPTSRGLDVTVTTSTRNFHAWWSICFISSSDLVCRFPERNNHFVMKLMLCDNINAHFPVQLSQTLQFFKRLKRYFQPPCGMLSG